MKKIMFILFCLFVFVGTLVIFTPEEISALPWYCRWYPPKDCIAEGGISLATQCDNEACDGGWGSSDQFCLICQK